jgi:hypothetical protein
MKTLSICSAALLILGTFVLVQPFQTPQAVSATYTQGVLHVSIPSKGMGRLTVDILDPEDRSIAHVDKQGSNASADVKLDRPIATEDLVWHRLRYRFTSSANQTVEGTESISQILRMPVVHIIGQQSYLAGSKAAVRVIASDAHNDPIPGQSAVRIELDNRTIFSGPLDRAGTTEPQFSLAATPGNHNLHYIVDTPIGSTEYSQQIRIEDKTSILLTTEKPIYQPGQTIHVRALALERSNHQASSARALTFEIEDSRGNKVFKKATQTDQYGVASAEFSLADEVNLGTYHLRAIMDGGNNAELALNVEKYVLPKFKVAVEFGDKTKHGYRPGDHVTGTVRANYFFGKPVNDAEITVKGTGIDVDTFEAGSTQGKTDRDGAYRFDLKLPDYFVGKPLAGGVARVLIEASVKDSAGHSETRGEPITVSTSPLIITAIPEGGALIPNLENQVFILTSYADGKPAKTEIKAADQAVSTDDSGVAVIRLAAARAEKLKIEAADKEGNRAMESVQLKTREGADQVLLRTEKAVYRAGDRIQLKIFSTKQRGTVYIDAIKEGQTILTRDLDLHNGQADLALPATADFSGTVDFNAYIFGADARPSADHRLVFVQPADELKIEASTDRASYKPGEDARIRFRVTNTKGEGVQAALGLQVVDEAVFALAEKQPGFAKVFFYLEQEALKPRYEIHSFGMPDVIEPAARDLAARALFAATETVGSNKFEIEAGKNIGAAKFPTYASRYQSEFVSKIPTQLAQAYSRSSGDLVKAAAAGPQIDDPWGTHVRIEPVSWNRQLFLIRSAGADKNFNDADDLVMYVTVRGGTYLHRPDAGTINLKIEHDRGPMNGLAQIGGSVLDATGAPLAHATLQITQSDTRNVRTAVTNNSGSFEFSGLKPGKYRLDVSSPGFRSLAQDIALDTRDSAVLTATLDTAMIVDKVQVEAAGVGFGGGGGGWHLGANRAVIGGLADMNGMRPVPMAAPQVTALMGANSFVVDGRPINGRLERADLKSKSDEPAARVRSYFPEALYINPEIITDKNGLASISIRMADSITTWRMAILASTTRGALGSGTSSIKVFQDFFADLDLPVTLTQGDRVSIPVAVYNYSGAPGDVRLKLQPEEWFSVVEDSPEKTLTVEPDRVGGSHFTIEAKRIGKFKLTLSANMKTRGDIVIREIEVVPNGREQTVVFNGRLDSAVSHELNFPANAIPDASKIFVRLYPGPLSQVIEGMDAILRMPGGCFEQTSSSTYPNVLALDYMQRTKKSTPEIHAKAEGFIANGYQRLLTFEVPGGGFSWFGQAPANKILTAYGLMEFSDMSKVHDVDSKVIARTQQWLASQQQPDGSWKPDTQFINEGATNRFNTDVLRITAYIAWSLENTSYQGPAVEKARQFVQSHMDAKRDAYTLAVIANFAADYQKDRAFTHQAIQQLLDARTEKDDQAWWSAEETNVYGRGASAAIETTGLAVQALLKSGESSAIAQHALTYIASKKDANGTWGTTQATIMALRAILLSTEKGAADVRGIVEVILNGSPAERLELTPENNDLLHQFVLKNIDAKNDKVEIRFTGKGGLAYQIAGRYFVPWTEKPANEPLSISVDYDRTRLKQDDIATATATVKNNLNKSANMVMVDLGIPPGFDLLSEDLQDYKEKSATAKSGRLEKFNMTATQAILYFDSISGGDTIRLKFRLRAKYPIRARTFQSRVYEYYEPEVNSVARPVQLEVRER